MLNTWVENQCEDDAEVWSKVVFAVEWLPTKSRFGLQRSERGHRVHWCHPGLWRWSAGGIPQGGSHVLQSILQEPSSEEQAPTSFDLHEGCEVRRSCGHDRLPLPWRGKCSPRKPGLLPCTCWRIAAERPHWNWEFWQDERTCKRSWGKLYKCSDKNGKTKRDTI